ncbi:MAG: hypothetical protein AABN33_23640 [Acidobacteriota bacterium]
MRIKKLFKREHTNKQPVDLEQVLSLDKLEGIFRPDYLNDQKIDYYFNQQYGDLVQFTRTQGNEIASEVGGTIKSNGGLPLLVSLQAESKLSAKLKSDAPETYCVATIARFNILKKFWSSQSKMISLNEIDNHSIPTSHTLIEEAFNLAVDFNGSWIDNQGFSPQLSKIPVLDYGFRFSAYIQ